MKNVTATSRWTASFLLLVMLVPAFGPFAMARLAPPEGMHCMRRPLPDAPAAAPAMQCHHAAQDAKAAQRGVAGNAASQISRGETSFRSVDCCCSNHDCYRGLKTSEWARPASNLLSVVRFPIEPAIPAQIALRVSALLSGLDFARAPPRV
jgi:hypothetical protein